MQIAEFVCLFIVFIHKLELADLKAIYLSNEEFSSFKKCFSSCHSKSVQAFTCCT